MSPRLAPLLAGFLLLAVTAGCASGLTQDAERLEKRFYVLRAERTWPPAAATAPGVCKVKRLTISPDFAGRELVYRVGENVFETDYYNLYHSAPADLLSQALSRWLDNSGLFEHVAEPSSDVRPFYLLEGNVVTLHGDFSDPDSPMAVLEMQFFLLKDEDFDYRIRMDADYRREIPMAERSAEGMISALNQGLAEILTRLEADLTQALP